MTSKQQKVYRRVMRRFRAGKLRSRYSGKLIRSERTARRLAQAAAEQVKE